MPLNVKDDKMAKLVAKLAKRRGLSKQDAVNMAVEAELDRTQRNVPLGETFTAWRAAHPLPPPTGEKADKNFFDELSGDL